MKESRFKNSREVGFIITRYEGGKMPVKTIINIASNPFGLAIISILLIAAGIINHQLSALILAGGLGLVVLGILIAISLRD